MGDITRRAIGRHLGKATWPRWVKRTLVIIGVVVCVFVLANVVMWVMYRGQVLPKYQVADVPVGGVAFDQLDRRVSLEQLLPKELTITKDAQQKKASPKELGVTIDWSATRQHIQNTRTWLPITSLFIRHEVPAVLRINSAVYDKASQGLVAGFSKAAVPEHLVFSGDTFSVAASVPGYTFDTATFKGQMLTALERGKRSLSAPIKATALTEPDGQLAQELAALQGRLGLKLVFSNAGQTRQLTKAEIGGLYEAAGRTMQPSKTLITQLVVRLGQELKVTTLNQNGSVSALTYALDKQQPMTFGLAKQGKIYQYCTAVRGVDASYLPGFEAKLAATYGDPRGWNSGGKLTLVHVSSGCDYTAWLSAPSSMTSFGGVCDDYYSCRSGSNVVINFDRWQGATPPWNAAGGNLEDYRVMVINHETGHWLGFGHASCPGAGKPAPVMMQQSISLAGCAFNPWPIASELTALNQRHNLAALPDRREQYLAAGAPCCACGKCTA